MPVRRVEPNRIVDWVPPAHPVEPELRSLASPRAVERRRDPGKQHVPATTAGQIMRPRVETVRHDSRLDAAAARLEDRSIRHLPVLDGDDTLVGILSDRDLLRASSAGIAPESPVSEVMSSPVIVATAETGIRDLADVMWTEGIHALPVTDQGRVVGIVTATDILRTVMNRAPVDLWI